MHLATEATYREAATVRLDRIQLKTIPDVGGRKMERLLAEKARIGRALRAWRRTAAIALASTVAAFAAEMALRSMDSSAAGGWPLMAALALGAVSAVLAAMRCFRWRGEARRNRAEIDLLHGKYGIGLPEREIALKRDAFEWNRAAAEFEARCRGSAARGGPSPREAAEREREGLLLRRQSRIDAIRALQERYLKRSGISWIHALDE